MKKEIRCTNCHEVESYPEEWEGINPMDQAYLEDGYLCERCQMAQDEEAYYRNGMAEMSGTGY